MKSIGVVVSILFLFIGITSCKSTQETTVEAAKKIPYFTFYTLDHQRFTQDNFDNTRTKFILYFNSECDHCQKQAKWLNQEIDQLEHLEMVFISFEEMAAIKDFKDSYDFNQSNITFLQDSRLTFSDKFGVESFPSILIYSKEGKLIKKFEGESRVETLLEYIK